MQYLDKIRKKNFLRSFILARGNILCFVLLLVNCGGSISATSQAYIEKEKLGNNNKEVKALKIRIEELQTQKDELEERKKNIEKNISFFKNQLKNQSQDETKIKELKEQIKSLENRIRIIEVEIKKIIKQVEFLRRIEQEKLKKLRDFSLEPLLEEMKQLNKEVGKASQEAKKIKEINKETNEKLEGLIQETKQ